MTVSLMFRVSNSTISQNLVFETPARVVTSVSYGELDECAKGELQSRGKVCCDPCKSFDIQQLMPDVLSAWSQIHGSNNPLTVICNST